MGLRLHVAKTYKVEWAKKEGYNYQVCEFKDVLDVLQIEHCDTDCIGDGLGYDFECEMESYIRGLKYLLKYINDGVSKDINVEDLNHCLNVMGKTKEKFYMDLKEYLDSADKNNSFIHFSFF